MKVIVLYSGGVDSTTLLSMAIGEHGKENVLALSILYGQKHEKELEAAKKAAEYYGVEQVFLDLGAIFLHSDSSLLSHSKKQVPSGSYEEQKQEEAGATVSTYVPFRNGLFLATAASVALSKDCEILYYGAHRDDAVGGAYPDCSEPFYSAMNQAIQEGSSHQLCLQAPFISLKKSDVVKKGLKLDVPYQLTWSCYEGSEKPCGTCGTCIDRQNAFLENGVKDPIEVI